MGLFSWVKRGDPVASNYADHPWFAGKAFTRDWTTSKLDTWHRLLDPHREEIARILEVGSFEGRSALFFLNFFPGADLTCIDLFEQQQPEGSPSLEDRFDANVASFSHRLRKLKGRSATELAKLVDADEAFDLIYIDGDHSRDPVLIDSLLAWQLLKPGGFLIWDDYLWAVPNRGRRHSPKQAIDTFVRLHRKRMSIVHRGYQVIIRRKVPKSP